MAWPKKKKEQPLRTQEWLLDQLRRPKVRAEDVGLTYAEVVRMGWTDEVRVRQAIQKAFPELRQAGVTQRTRKVWDKVYDIARPTNSTRIEGSLWRVGFQNSRANLSTLNPPKRPRSWSSYQRPLRELYHLGWVEAATAEEAKQIAQVSFGPIAMFNPECIEVERRGPDGWKAGENNEARVRELHATVEEIEEQVAMMQWEVEQLKTLATLIGG